MSFEQLKQQVTTLSDQEQAELISFTLQLRYARAADYRRQVTDRLNDRDESHWLTPDEFGRRLGHS